MPNVLKKRELKAESKHCSYPPPVVISKQSENLNLEKPYSQLHITNLRAELKKFSNEMIKISLKKKPMELT